MREVFVLKSLKYLCLQATEQGQASYAHVHEIINGLKKRNWQIELYEPYYAKVNGSSVAWWRRAIQFIKVQRQLMQNCKETDILYIRSHFAAFPTALWAKIKRIPSIQEINGPYEDLFLAWPWTRYFSCIFKWMMKKQWQWANACIAVTPNLAEWVQSETRISEVHVIPNGANIDLFKPSAYCNYELPQKYVIFFGAMAVWQGLDIILKAMELSDWPSELSFVACGNGPDRPLIEDASKKDKRIIYLGSLPYRDIPGVVCHSLAGIISKNNKGNRVATGLYPLKMFETLSCGVPVIVTDFPGQADIVRDNSCGIVIPVDDPHALAQAVNYLYNHPSQAKGMGKRGRYLVEKEFSWDRMAELTNRVITSVLEGSH
jgi:glycosyltransferase involved in cell wall biosynthesis